MRSCLQEQMWSRNHLDGGFRSQHQQFLKADGAQDLILCWLEQKDGRSQTTQHGSRFTCEGLAQAVGKYMRFHRADCILHRHHQRIGGGSPCQEEPNYDFGRRYEKANGRYKQSKAPEPSPDRARSEPRTDDKAPQVCPWGGSPLNGEGC